MLFVASGTNWNYLKNVWMIGRWESQVRSSMMMTLTKLKIDGKIECSKKPALWHITALMGYVYNGHWYWIREGAWLSICTSSLTWSCRRLLRSVGAQMVECSKIYCIQVGEARLGMRDKIHDHSVRLSGCTCMDSTLFPGTCHGIGYIFLAM